MVCCDVSDWAVLNTAIRRVIICYITIWGKFNLGMLYWRIKARLKCAYLQTYSPPWLARSLDAGTRPFWLGTLRKLVSPLHQLSTRPLSSEAAVCHNKAPRRGALAFATDYYIADSRFQIQLWMFQLDARTDLSHNELPYMGRREFC